MTPTKGGEGPVPPANTAHNLTRAGWEIPDRYYPVGLTRAEINALRSILAKAEHAVANATKPERT